MLYSQDHDGFGGGGVTELTAYASLKEHAFLTSEWQLHGC